MLNPILLCGYPNTEADFIIPVTQNQKFTHCILCEESLWQNQIIKYLKSIYKCVGTETESLISQGCFAMVLSLLYENSPIFCDFDKTLNNDLLSFQTMITFIQNNYTEKLSLKQIAHIGNVGESKCCRLFHKYLNKTPIEHLTNFRLNKGAGLLKDSDLNISEISYAIGLNGGSYFAEAFKKWIGMSPTEYRNENMIKVAMKKENL